MRLFKRCNPDLGRIFEPDHHIAYWGFDLNKLTAGGFFGRPHPALPALLLKTMEMLRINLVARAFTDRLIQFPDGRRVLLHIVLDIKNHDEPFDDAVWNRLAWIHRMADQRINPFQVNLKGAVVMPVGLPALYLATTTAEHDRLQSEQGYPSRTLFLISDHHEADSAELDDDFHQSQAIWMEQQLERLESEWPRSHLNRGYIFVAPQLSNAAPAGSRVSKYRAFGEATDE